MARLHLSCFGYAGSVSGKAHYHLFVSVTDSDGAPRTDLGRDNFSLAWFQGLTDVPMRVVAFRAADGSSGLPMLRGVYVLELQAENFTWTQGARDGAGLFVGVRAGTSQGQVLHMALAGQVTRRG